MDDRTGRALRYYARHPHHVVAQVQRFRRSRPHAGRFVFVMGPPRSGTTLIHRLLLNHSHLEGFSYETSIISPKPIFDPARFTHYVDAHVHAQALAQTRDLPGFFARLHELALPAPPPGGWFVEKTPQHARRLRFILDMFPAARVVFCVRDGRDTFCSGRAAGNIPQARDVARHARYFDACMAPYFGTAPDPRVRLLRYEDFVADPWPQLADLMRFVDLEAEPGQRDTARTGRDARAAHKAFDRLSKPIDAGTVARWRDEMTPEEIARYERIAGPALDRLDYARA